MRYIRTKDGRIAEIKENMIIRVFDDATRLVYKDRPYSCVLTGDDDILKQADIIEELCDGILVEEIDNESNWFIMETDELKRMSKEEIENHLTSWRFNLFIKNDRGLIYVAKMNEKGELELK